MGWFPCCKDCKVFDSAPWTGWTGGTVTGDTLKLAMTEVAYTDALSVTNEWHNATVHLRRHSDVGTPSNVILDARIRLDDADEIRVVIDDCMVQVIGRFCAPLQLRQTSEGFCNTCEDYAYISGGAGGRCEQCKVTAVRCGEYIQFAVDLLNADGERIVLYPMAKALIPDLGNRRWAIKNVGESNLELVESQGYGSLVAAPNGSCEQECVSEIPCESGPEPCDAKRGLYQIVMEVSGFPEVANFVTYYQSGQPSSAENGFDCQVTTTVTGLDALNGTYIGVPRALAPDPCFPPFVQSDWEVGTWTASRTITHIDDNGEACTNCLELAPTSGTLYALIREFIELGGAPQTITSNGWTGMVYGFPAGPWCDILGTSPVAPGNPQCEASAGGYLEDPPIYSGFRVCGTCAQDDEEWENFLGSTEVPDPFSGIIYYDPLKGVKIRVYLMRPEL